MTLTARVPSGTIDGGRFATRSAPEPPGTLTLAAPDAAATAVRYTAPGPATGHRASLDEFGGLIGRIRRVEGRCDDYVDHLGRRTPAVIMHYGGDPLPEAVREEYWTAGVPHDGSGATPTILEEINTGPKAGMRILRRGFRQPTAGLHRPEGAFVPCSPPDGQPAYSRRLADGSGLDEWTDAHGRQTREVTYRPGGAPELVRTFDHGALNDRVDQDGQALDPRTSR